MKVIINVCYGNFGVSEEWARRLGTIAYNTKELRYNTELIEAIENGEDVNASYSRLKVVEIPANCTDYEIEEYDGCESIAYVVDGKIHHIY